MLELPYSAHISCGGLFSDKVSLLLQLFQVGVSCVLVMMSFDVLVPVGGSLDVQ